VQISVNVLGRGGPEATAACLAHLQGRLPDGTRVRWLAAGANDDSREGVVRAFPDVEIVRLPAGLGFAGAHNLGLRRAFTALDDFVLMLSVAARPVAGFLPPLLEVMKMRPRAAFVSPKIALASDPGRLWYAGGEIDWWRGRVTQRGAGTPDDGRFDRPGPTNFATAVAMLVRRQAFEGVFDTYGALRNTFAALLDGQVRNHVFTARARQFDGPLQAALHPDNVQLEVYEGLIQAVHDRLDDFYRYVTLRREVLGLPQLNMYDQHVPLVPELELEVSFEQARDWVIAACAPLGEAYVQRLRRAFDERWIDVHECRGKRSGGYSSGVYDSPPYILLNWQDNLDSAYTLMHELGHSLHTQFSREAQPHATARYRILVAEVASITNEMLLTDHLLKQSEDPRFRAYLANKLCDQFRGTVFRQTMFAEFEKLIHDLVTQGQALTPEALCRNYFSLNQTYYGPEVKPDQRIEMEWARIPHFYYNFYVYKYATGFCAAQVLAERLLSGEQGAVGRYLDFLAAGDSDEPLALLAAAGCDLREPAVIRDGLQRFATAVTELQTQLQSLPADS